MYISWCKCVIESESVCKSEYKCVLVCKSVWDSKSVK